MCFCRGGGSLTVKHAELSLVQVAGTAGRIERGESSLASFSNSNSDACELRNQKRWTVIVWTAPGFQCVI